MTRILLLVITFLARELAAQTPPIEPLAPPVSALMMCAFESDSSGVLLEFTDFGNTFRKRESTLFFDSSGTPRLMVVTAEGPGVEGKTVLHAIVVRFAPIAEGATTVFKGFDPNFRVPLLRPEDSVEKLPSGWSKITTEEVNQARQLASEFWKRRCSKVQKPARPTTPPITG